MTRSTLRNAESADATGHPLRRATATSVASNAPSRGVLSKKLQRFGQVVIVGPDQRTEANGELSRSHCGVAPWTTTGSHVGELLNHLDGYRGSDDAVEHQCDQRTARHPQCLIVANCVNEDAGVEQNHPNRRARADSSVAVEH